MERECDSGRACARAELGGLDNIVVVLLGICRPPETATAYEDSVVLKASSTCTNASSGVDLCAAHVYHMEL